MKLTRRQYQVLALLAQGRSLTEAAEALDISEKTASIHLQKAYRRLNVHSRTGAFIEMGWLTVP